MTEMVSNTDDGMSGDPACNADDQAIQIQTSELAVCCVSGLVSGVVDDQAAVNAVLEFGLQSSQRFIRLHLQTLDGGVDLTEANISNAVVHNIFLSNNLR